MIRILSVAALAALLMTGSAHAATLVLDGNFVNTAVNPPGYTTYNSGQTFGGGAWTVTTGSVDLIDQYWLPPTPGTGSVDLDGNSPGGIAQTFTAPAGNYVLTFDLSGNPDGAPTTKSLQVSVGGTVEDITYTLTGANNHTNMLYVPETVDFTSTGAPIPLSFLSLDTNTPFGPVIGDVSASATPLPASLLLFGSGLLGLVLFVRRRQLAKA